MRSAQENLRLSASQNAKMANEIKDYKRKIESNNQENIMLRSKIDKLSGENVNLGE